VDSNPPNEEENLSTEISEGNGRDLGPVKKSEPPGGSFGKWKEGGHLGGVCGGRVIKKKKLLITGLGRQKAKLSGIKGER